MTPEGRMHGLFLGIDCGTQGSKALLLDAGSGRTLGLGSAAQRPPEGRDGRREQDPADWLEAMASAVRMALEEAAVDGREVRALAVSAQQHGLLLLDAEGRALRPAKLWCDTESAAENRELLEALGGPAGSLERLGLVLAPGYTLSKLLWSRRRFPELFARVAHILLPHDYLNHWLTGRVCSEAGDASGSGYFDVRRRTWASDVLELVEPGGRLAAALPAFSGAIAIGAEGQGAPAVATEAASGEGEASAAAPTLQPFQGAIDELRLSKIARPAALLLADATAQGAESRLVAYGVDEKQSGFGFGKLGFLLNAVPLDAWVIIAILALMMVQSWVIMYRKNQNVGRVSRANGLFRERFAEVGTRLELLADDRELAARLQHSSLWRLYQVAVKEIRTRREQGADTSSVSAATIEAIRASMDGVRTKENQQLGSRLSSLSNAIAGGPYIGLLGTVLGIMVVFLGTAMAGDVNINAIAPGMAAALLATAMGLFVAIPALFGYNRLVTRNKEVSADMRVFVDEFVTRLAEVHGESQLSEVAHRRNGQPLPA
ncbi:FGGY family carbohydrate kinase [Pseudomonas aeruginosa]|uniref:FGGY family carbohydrate kinase n=2 Tax=Pseudomonas aeruginosa TaxID=287 RepID=UPI0009A501EB|nr:FGGY family carbohydrate kinase [Pseudomonas aeruginosa]